MLSSIVFIRIFSDFVEIPPPQDQVARVFPPKNPGNVPRSDIEARILPAASRPGNTKTRPSPPSTLAQFHAEKSGFQNLGALGVLAVPHPHLRIPTSHFKIHQSQIINQSISSPLNPAFLSDLRASATPSPINFLRIRPQDR